MPARSIARTAENFPAQPDVLFRAAADQAPQVMWIVNTKGAVTYLNQAWYQLVGGAPPQWYGHAWADAVVTEDVVQMRQRWRIASAGAGVFEGTRRVRSVDGSLHVLAYKATPVHDRQGRVICWVGMDADITAIMATKAALRFANQELEAFSNSVSHDLRSPLVTVQGFTAMLARQLGASADPKVLHYLDRIGQGADHMARLLDGLLVLSQVGRRELDRQDVDLSRIASDILEAHRARQPERQVVCKVQPAMWAHADRSLMAVLLENLLGNSWKFTAHEAQPCIDVSQMAGAAGEQVFAVRDNGCGFDMAHAGQLFVPFQRLHTDQEFPGTGIGLATVQRIVARHGGRAWARAETGRGATLFFALPGGPLAVG